MKQTVHFTKMHGAGNDYIYVDTLYYYNARVREFAIEWSRPHYGIGADGLVLIGRPTDDVKADFSMHIYNADGSEAQMCGNAARCIGKYVYEKGLTEKTVIRLETLSGIKQLQLHITDDNTVDSVTVDMLAPVLEDKSLFTGNLNGTFVSMGNPHFVVFTDDVETLDVERQGKLLEHNPAFPERCNIEFAQVTGPDRVRMRVWERGSGITLACGTGACATAVAAALTGRTSRNVIIDMDGGTLNIEWRAADNHVMMTGDATIVYEGDININNTWLS